MLNYKALTCLVCNIHVYLSRQSLDYYNCWQLAYLIKRSFVFSFIKIYVFRNISLSVFKFIRLYINRFIHI